MSSTEIVPGRMPQERRQTIMRQYVHGATFQGWRVETADDCQAVLVGEVPVNHVRHVRPGGHPSGAPVGTGGVQRRHAYVDEYGNVIVATRTSAR